MLMSEGDLARVVNNHAGHGLEFGDIARVLRVDFSESLPYVAYSLDTEPDDYWYFTEDDLEFFKAPTNLSAKNLLSKDF